MDDWQLLKNYAVNHSEEAFRELVERYSGMVYHAALRQTGNPHAAEEAAQVVFIALAQKAGRIPRQATLYGWLFRATRFAVLNQVRQNANRERHEHEAIIMQPTIESNEADSTWERITPQLNDALDSLSEADRDLVMIRFFGNKSHKEVAEAVGVSEETARKRLSRAMERLRTIFARRGVVVSSLALTGALAAHGAKAAPVESASSWAKLALAKAAAGAAGGLLAFLTGSKVVVPVAALVLAGVVLTIYKAKTRETLPAAQIAVAVDALETNETVAAAPQPAAVAPVPAAALDRVYAALHDTNETTVYPNSVMQDAIAGLGDQKQAALPILEKGLTDADAEVRLRAVDGLGLVGPEAGEAAPAILALLKNGGFGEDFPHPSYDTREVLPNGRVATIYTDNIILYALGQVHAGAQFLPEFARSIQESAIVRNAIYRALRQFPVYQRTLVRGGWLWEMAGEDAHALNTAWRPLLQDTNFQVRVTAALALVATLGNQADAGVFPVAVEMMNYDDEVFMKPDGLSLLTGAARDLSAGAQDVSPILYASRLGPYLNETVSALGGIAYQSKNERSRLAAEKKLSVLVPDLAKSNPTLAAELEQEKEENEFEDRAISGEKSTAEILAGIKKFPKTAPRIADNFARNGSNAVEFLPAFAEALAALAPAPDASVGDRTLAVNQRAMLAEAMEKLAPDQPKPIFTVRETIALRQVMGDQASQVDAGHAQKIAEAEQLAGWPSGFTDVSQDMVRRLLTAMKEADATTYAALVAKVKEIDPHFSESEGGKGN